jgi:hypothetical protein
MKLELNYKNKSYIVSDDTLNTDKNGKNDPPFIWDDVEYNCDCVRSMFIKNCFNGNFPKLSCGNKIKLLRVIE